MPEGASGRIQWPDWSRLSRRPAALSRLTGEQKALGLAVIAVVILLRVPALRDYLDRHTGAVTFIAALVAAYYAWLTRQLARATGEMSIATQEMASATQQQRRDAVRPVIIFTDLKMTGNGYNDFLVHTKNGGAGPALSVRFDVIDRSVPLRVPGHIRPVALGVGDIVPPFPVELDEAESDNIERREADVLHRNTDPFWRLGTLRATYESVHGEVIESNAVVEWIPSSGLLRFGEMNFQALGIRLSGVSTGRSDSEGNLSAGSEREPGTRVEA